jgi:hypothetical protein
VLIVTSNLHYILLVCLLLQQFVNRNLLTADLK